jgi:hypothetical protein
MTLTEAALTALTIAALFLFRAWGETLPGGSDE